MNILRFDFLLAVAEPNYDSLIELRSSLGYIVMQIISDRRGELI